MQTTLLDILNNAAQSVVHNPLTLEQLNSGVGEINEGLAKIMSTTGNDDWKMILVEHMGKETLKFIEVLRESTINNTPVPVIYQPVYQYLRNAAAAKVGGDRQEFIYQTELIGLESFRILAKQHFQDNPFLVDALDTFIAEYRFKHNPVLH